MISVIIPTYRNPKYLDLCLKSLADNTVLTTTEIIVVVDGYIEESQEVLDRYPSISVLPFEENMGMQYAINAGVMQATKEYVFVINDDNVFGPTWDTVLQSALVGMRTTEDDKQVFTVNQVEPTGPSMFNFPIKNLGADIDTFDYTEWILFEPTIRNISGSTPEGRIFPFLMQKKHYLAVGGLDTFYNSPNICDWDFFLRLELLGFTFIRTLAIHLYHFGSVSTKKNAEQESFRAKEQAAIEQYEWKWGAMPYNGLHNTKIPPSRKFRGFSV